MSAVQKRKIKNTTRAERGVALVQKTFSVCVITETVGEEFQLLFFEYVILWKRTFEERAIIWKRK